MVEKFFEFENIVFGVVGLDVRVKCYPKLTADYELIKKGNYHPGQFIEPLTLIEFRDMQRQFAVKLDAKQHPSWEINAHFGVNLLPVMEVLQPLSETIVEAGVEAHKSFDFWNELLPCSEGHSYAFYLDQKDGQDVVWVDLEEYLPDSDYVLCFSPKTTNIRFKSQLFPYENCAKVPHSILKAMRKFCHIQESRPLDMDGQAIEQFEQNLRSLVLKELLNK